MGFNRVIAAFDGSPQGTEALALALRLRDPADGILTLACVVSGQRWHVGAHVRRPDATVPEEIDRMFADARATAIPRGVPVRVRAPVAPSPTRGLTELAESEGADLIVVGSSTHAGTGRISLERTAGRLLEGAPCAVAVAPGGLSESGGFRHIGVAYDGSPETRACLSAAYDLAARGGAAVTLAYALGSEPLRREAKIHAAETLEAAVGEAPQGVSPKTLVLHGGPRDIAEAFEGVVDLLVTGSHSYGPMERALLGSVSETLTEGAPHPVLVVPRGAGERSRDPAVASLEVGR